MPHGYALHLDATCDKGKGGTFLCLDAWTGWVLHAARIGSAQQRAFAGRRTHPGRLWRPRSRREQRVLRQVAAALAELGRLDPQARAARPSWSAAGPCSASCGSPLAYPTRNCLASSARLPPTSAGRAVAVVDRTNNVIEHFFAIAKQGLRR